MPKRTIDTFTAVALALSILLGTWFGAAMHSALIGVIAVVFLCAMALVLGGMVMYALGPGAEHVRRFGQTADD